MLVGPEKLDGVDANDRRGTAVWNTAFKPLVAFGSSKNGI